MVKLFIDAAILFDTDSNVFRASVGEHILVKEFLIAPCTEDGISPAYSWKLE